MEISSYFVIRLVDLKLLILSRNFRLHCVITVSFFYCFQLCFSLSFICFFGDLCIYFSPSFLPFFPPSFLSSFFLPSFCKSFLKYLCFFSLSFPLSFPTSLSSCTYSALYLFHIAASNTKNVFQKKQLSRCLSVCLSQRHSHWSSWKPDDLMWNTMRNGRVGGRGDR